MIFSIFERYEDHWFFKYKLYHIPFWAIFNLMWGFANMIWTENFLANFFSIRFVQFFFYLFIEVSAVYINLYFLIPRFLQRGKMYTYISLLVVCIVGASFLLTSTYFVTSYITGKSLDYFCYMNDQEYYYLFFVTTKAFPTIVAVMVIAMSIKLSKNWLKAQRRQQDLEKEKLETELKFLKYQFNPHFLFNTINSIFFLIHKDPEKASTSLAKFSDLLRYQLYECNEMQIPLNQEIAYLENFVALEKLRRGENFKVELILDHKNKGYLGVAPFILMTFVENAFKHVSKHKDQTNWVNIYLKIEDEKSLSFEVVNSKSETEDQGKEAIKYGGIGLKNVKRRLDLIYPDQHDLIIEDLGVTFWVKMKLQLTEVLDIEEVTVKKQAPKILN